MAFESFASKFANNVLTSSCVYSFRAVEVPVPVPVLTMTFGPLLNESASVLVPIPVLVDRDVPSTFVPSAERPLTVSVPVPPALVVKLVPVTLVLRVERPVSVPVPALVVTVVPVVPVGVPNMP